MFWYDATKTYLIMLINHLTINRIIQHLTGYDLGRLILDKILKRYKLNSWQHWVFYNLFSILATLLS